MQVGINSKGALPLKNKKKHMIENNAYQAPFLAVSGITIVIMIVGPIWAIKALPNWPAQIIRNRPTNSFLGSVKNRPKSAIIQSADIRHIPTLTGATTWFNNKSLTSSEMRRKIVLLNFWGYSCGTNFNLFVSKTSR
jgi:hypothetical protein